MRLVSFLAAGGLSVSAATIGVATGQTPGRASTTAATAATTDPYLARALRVLQASPVMDGHNDLPWRIREDSAHPQDVEAYDLTKRTPGHTDLARLQAGHVGAQFWSVYTPGEVTDPVYRRNGDVTSTPGYARVQLEQIAIARAVIAKYPKLERATTAAEVRASFAHGRIGSLMGMEGGHAIENSLSLLRDYYALGVRYMTLTHNVTLDWADAALDSARHGGLTPFGEEVVREMNRLGMVVDLAHVSPGTMSDALNVSEAPVMFSHSGARALVDHRRNVPDSILARVAKNGGVVMVPFVPEFVAKPGTRATLTDVADHIDHVAKVAGYDHVGIGSDFDGIDSTVVGLEDVSKFPALFAELARRGWSDANLAKLADGNILRVLADVERVSKRLQQTRKPSTATLESLDRPPHSTP